MITSVLMVLPSLLKWVADVSTFVKYFDLSMEQSATRMFPAHLTQNSMSKWLANYQIKSEGEIII